MDGAITAVGVMEMLQAAAEYGLPPVTRAEYSATTVHLIVADRAAVEEWARRLEQPVTSKLGRAYTGFSFRDGHSVTISGKE